MCQFVEAMEGLKSSSSLSVANEKFSDFNQYMHITSKMDIKLKEIIEDAKQNHKSLVLVCGNSGDGKSHLIANFIKNKIIDGSDFDVYIDATSSDKKGKKANEKLREKLEEFSDEKILDRNTYRLIVAINLGILNDFLKNYESDYKVLSDYINRQGLFDNIPAWKIIQMEKKEEKIEKYYIGHVDFTYFHRYEVKKTGVDEWFYSELLDKIICDDESNVIFKTYRDDCESCHNKINCPVYWNYKILRKSEVLRNHIVYVLTKAIIKWNLSPSVREINDFYYEIIVGRMFDQEKIYEKSINRLMHFIKNMTLWLLYENAEGLLQYVSKEDVLADPIRSFDGQLINLNLKANFAKWLQDEASQVSEIYSQILDDVLYCKNLNAKNFSDKEQEIKQVVFKLFIRSTNLIKSEDKNYSDYLKYLYYYNVGAEDKCKNLIQLVEECIYLWNGRLGDKSGTNIKYGVIISNVSSNYFLFKKIEIRFVKNTDIEKVDDNLELPFFSTVMRFGFMQKEGKKEGKKVIWLDVDYELYSFLLEVKAGFVPSISDRKKNVKYDSFVRNIIAESESDIYVYSRNENGKVYRISSDDFDNYTFGIEV